MSAITKISGEFLKAGERFITTARPPKIHGINPILKMKNGIEIPLPRFCSVEMQTAVKMNKTVIHTVKTPPLRSYSKASPEDLRRLTSDTMEDSYSRVEWTNPKDGKVYNILKQGETEDGKIAVRILDKDGGFVKEAELTPKTIAINDYFTKENPFDKSYEALGLLHGELCLTYARRNNPFAKYITFDIDVKKLASDSELEKIKEYLDAGGKIDYLSCSYGINVYAKDKLKSTMRYFNAKVKDLFATEHGYDDLSKKGVRILCSGNNKTADMLSPNECSNQILVLNNKVEGVGSINPKTGKISDFSLSRNSELTQHYEVGEYTPVLTSEGINITGLPGTDIPVKSPALETLRSNPLIGKSVDRVKHLREVIDSRIKDLQKESIKLFSKKGLTFEELSRQRAKIEEMKSIYEKRRSKIISSQYELIEQDGKYRAALSPIMGTSFSAPVRTAKLALNDMLEGIL